MWGSWWRRNFTLSKRNEKKSNLEFCYSQPAAQLCAPQSFLSPSNVWCVVCCLFLDTRNRASTPKILYIFISLLSSWPLIESIQAISFLSKSHYQFWFEFLCFSGNVAPWDTKKSSLWNNFTCKTSRSDLIWLSFSNRLNPTLDSRVCREEKK